MTTDDFLCLKNVGTQISMSVVRASNELSAPIAIEKIEIPGAVLEVPVKRHCQSSPFITKMGQMGWIGSAV